MKKYFSVITKGIGPFSRVICKGIGLGPTVRKWLFTDTNVEAYLEPEKDIIAEIAE